MFAVQTLLFHFFLRKEQSLGSQDTLRFVENHTEKDNDVVAHESMMKESANSFNIMHQTWIVKELYEISKSTKSV